jgi:hypothetical protein
MVGSNVATASMAPPGPKTRATAEELRVTALAAPIPEALGLGQMLDETVIQYRTHFMPLTIVALLFAFPLQLVSVGISQVGLEEAEILSTQMLWVLMAVPAQVAVNAFAFAYVGAALSGRPRTPREAAGLALSKAPALTGVFLVAGLVTLMTCGIGGFVVNWLTGPAIGLIVVEGCPFRSVISRSFALANGWASFGRWMGIYMITTLVLGSLGGIEGALQSENVRSSLLAQSFIGATFLDVILPLLSAVLMSVQLAVLSVSLVIFYLDLCVRRRGLDLNRRLDRLKEARRNPRAEGRFA